ncbi:MAG: chromosome segregation protein SMC [Clostridia bacterium]|nr:chromosome segregation protein SMC [Clostridia bacterium]
MYLKRIELQGFKSFADKTVIEVHQGITAIVGPNGSGKSNISDAVRWVMGEQSAKTLRGGKMEDVIFAGTQKRKPLGYAEVSLVLDNSTHFLSCEYNEVEVTRRVFRSGESEYMINRTPCRLKDINEMFMDTGLGRDGYSIVGQGKIAEIVSSKGDERRQIFEEAAGISKYRYRKNEAERKLSHTEDNLVRVRDILSEISDRVEPLRKQSEKALKYLDLREELKGIEVSALLEIIDAKRIDAQKTDELYKNAQTEFNEAKSKLDEYNEKSDKLYNDIKEHNSEIDVKREHLSEVEAASVNVGNEKIIIKNSIENHKSNISRIDAEISGWTQKDDSLHKMKSNYEEEKLKLIEKENMLNEELEKLEVIDKELFEELNKRNSSLESAKDEALNLRRKKSEAQTRIDSIDLITQNIESRRFSIEVDIASASDDINQLSKKCEKLSEDIQLAEKETEEYDNKVFDCNKHYLAQAQKSTELKTSYNNLVQSLGEKQGRLKMLEEMEKALDGYSRGVKELIKAKAENRYTGNLIGVLSSLIAVDKKYITAIETALGNTMQNIVVNNEEDAKEAIEYLKAKHLGRVTFLPISSQEGKRLDNEKRVMENIGALEIASDVVACDDNIKDVIEALLGRTVIMDNIDNAVKLARATHYKFKIVTLSGELLQPGGSVTGGSINKAQALLGRKDEIDALKVECDKLNEKSERLEDEIDEAEEKASKYYEEEKILREKLAEKENYLLKLKAESEMNENLLCIAKERFSKLETEKANISTQQSDTANSKKQLLEVISGSDALIEKADAFVSQKQEEVRKAILNREKHSVLIVDKRMEINNAQKDIDVMNERINDVILNLHNSKSDYNDKLLLRKSEEEAIEKLNIRLEENEKLSLEFVEKIKTAKEEIKAYVEQNSGSDVELEKLREAIKDLNERILVLQGEVVRVENKKLKIEEDLESASNRLWDDYELTYNNALEQKKDIGSLPEAQKRIVQLKNIIRSLGNINIDAIEEYKEVKERYEFLTTQVADMEKAKADLEKLIGEMMGIMREQFAEKFEIINKLFQKSFTDLFGGGKAEVKLLNPLDTLESPIEIEVQPPGKKLQNISLLSGGEHALTAIALLFALLQVSPAPFLVLDEIEAALDDENVYRFGDYIRNYGTNTQFVIITHRRGTMEAADVLYGVTMQERGVSRLLSMKLDEVAFEE